MIDALLSWLPTYLLHSSALLGGLWLLERAGALAALAPAGREGLWRTALLGGVLSASLTVLAPLLRASTEAGPVLAAPALNEPSPVASTARPLQTVAPVQTFTPATPAHPTEPTLPGWRESLVALCALWLLGALGGLAGLAGQWAALRRALARLPLVQDPRWLRLAAETAAAHRLAPPRLRRSATWASPLLAPGGTVCLPGWALSLDDTAARAVLGHELAHLRRRDPAWRLLGEALSRLLWLQPLNALALRRLDLLAELACDEAAAARPAERAALAESLLRCAEQQQGMALPALACSVGGKHSPLALRVRQLLAGPTAPPPGTGKLRRGLILAGLTLTVLALPLVAVRHSDAHALLERLDLPQVMIDLGTSGPSTRIRSESPGSRLAVNLKGRVDFNADETDIESLSGSLKVRERSSGVTREMRLQTDAAGALQREYQLDGQPAELDDAARAWWQGVVPRLAELLIRPPERARRLLAQGGLPAVLRDLDKPRDDFALRERIEAALGLGVAFDAAAQDRLLDAAGRIGGDFERREALSAIVRKAGALADAQQLRLLAVAARIDGDFELRETLTTLAPTLSHSPEVLAAWGRSLASLDGDFELRSVLQTQLEHRPDAAVLAAVLAASERLSGGFERREALSAVARQLRGDEAELVAAYLHSVAGTPGDFERRQALVALLDRKQLQRSGFEQVIAAATEIDGGFERLEVLKRVAELIPADAELAMQVRRAGRGLSDFERGQLENALDRHGG